MPSTTPRPDIHSMLDAYAVLDVEHSANPAEVRHAYKRMARKHHPDRHPTGSEAQRQATERMTAVNAAYQLVRDAPLRHHRVATQSQPDVPWTDAELDAAIVRARIDRRFSKGMDIVCVAVLGIFLPWFVGSMTAPGISPVFLIFTTVTVSLLSWVLMSRDIRLYFVWEALLALRCLIRF